MLCSFNLFKISFDFDNENDDVTIDDSEENSVSLTEESNSIKVLIKAMVGYEATCTLVSSPSYETNENGERVPFCNQGELYKENNNYILEENFKSIFHS